MAHTKQTPVKGKYFKTPLYRYTNDKIELTSHTPRTLNYIPLYAHCFAKYRAHKAKWEAENPDTPYLY
jgi:hypothetical protein